MKLLIPYIFAMLLIGGCKKKDPPAPVIPPLPCELSSKNFAGLYVSKKNYKDTILLAWIGYNCPNEQSSVYLAGNIPSAINRHLKSPLPLDTLFTFYSNENNMTSYTANNKYQFVKEDSLYILWPDNLKKVEAIYFRKLQ